MPRSTSSASSTVRTTAATPPAATIESIEACCRSVAPLRFAGILTSRAKYTLSRQPTRSSMPDEYIDPWGCSMWMSGNSAFAALTILPRSRVSPLLATLLCPLPLLQLLDLGLQLVDPFREAEVVDLVPLVALPLTDVDVEVQRRLQRLLHVARRGVGLTCSFEQLVTKFFHAASTAYRSSSSSMSSSSSSSSSSASRRASRISSSSHLVFFLMPAFLRARRS